MIHTNAIHGLTVRHTDLQRDLLIDQTLVLNIDHALIQKNTVSRNIQVHTNHLLDQETIDTLDLVHILTLEMFYTLYVHTPSSMVQRDNPSRLEIAFLLDSGASISVLNYPTYKTLTKLLDIRPNHTSDLQPQHSSKTLTVANQTEVPILHYANIILNITIDDNSRSFSVPFAVADIEYNILGTPSFEDNLQNIYIQDFTLEFKYQSKIYPNYTKFTPLLSKDYPYFLTFTESTLKLKYA